MERQEQEEMKLGLLMGALAVSVLSAGCFNAEAYNAKSVADIRARAAFDMHCDANALTFAPLAGHPYNDDIVLQYGVEGCGQRVVYVHTAASGWVANAHTDDKPAPAGK